MGIFRFDRDGRLLAFEEGVRLVNVNERHVDEADGDGYYIRNGIIVVPQGGVVKAGTAV